MADNTEQPLRARSSSPMWPPVTAWCGAGARSLVPLYALAAAVLCGAAGNLLKELAPLLRPLTLAVFLAYTILPAHRRLSRRVPARLAGPLLALLVAGVVLGLAVLVYGNLVDLKAELPRLIERARGLTAGLRTWGRDHLPAWASTRRRTRTAPRRRPPRGSRPSRPAWSTPRPASWPRPWSSCSTWSSSCSRRVASRRGSGPGSRPNRPTACSGSSRRSTARWRRTSGPRCSPAC